MPVERDVTARAVQESSLVANRVLEMLARQLFTGPNNVRLTGPDAQNAIQQGNAAVLRQAMQQMDVDQVSRLANA